MAIRALVVLALLACVACTGRTPAPDAAATYMIDSGWREVAETALAFVKRFA